MAARLAPQTRQANAVAAGPSPGHRAPAARKKIKVCDFFDSPPVRAFVGSVLPSFRVPTGLDVDFCGGGSVCRPGCSTCTWKKCLWGRCASMTGVCDCSACKSRLRLPDYPCGVSLHFQSVDVSPALRKGLAFAKQVCNCLSLLAQMEGVPDAILDAPASAGGSLVNEAAKLVAQSHTCVRDLLINPSSNRASKWNSLLTQLHADRSYDRQLSVLVPTKSDIDEKFYLQVTIEVALCLAPLSSAVGCPALLSMLEEKLYEGAEMLGNGVEQLLINFVRGISRDLVSHFAGAVLGVPEHVRQLHTSMDGAGTLVSDLGDEAAGLLNSMVSRVESVSSRVDTMQSRLQDVGDHVDQMANDLLLLVEAGSRFKESLASLKKSKIAMAVEAIQSMFTGKGTPNPLLLLQDLPELQQSLSTARSLPQSFRALRADLESVRADIDGLGADLAAVRDDAGKLVDAVITASVEAWRGVSQLAEQVQQLSVSVQGVPGAITTAISHLDKLPIFDKIQDVDMPKFGLVTYRRSKTISLTVPCTQRKDHCWWWPFNQNKKTCFDWFTVKGCEYEKTVPFPNSFIPYMLIRVKQR